MRWILFTSDPGPLDDLIAYLIVDCRRSVPLSRGLPLGPGAQKDVIRELLTKFCVDTGQRSQS